MDDYLYVRFPLLELEADINANGDMFIGKPIKHNGKKVGEVLKVSHAGGSISLLGSIDSKHADTIKDMQNSHCSNISMGVTENEGNLNIL